MKKAIKILSAVVLFTLLSAGITYGQNTNTGKIDKEKSSNIVEKAKMKDGKMMMKIDNDWVTMDKDLVLGGTTVMTNGNVKTRDGSIVKLMEGDCVDDNGKIYDKNKKMRGAAKEEVKEHNKDVKEEKKEERKRD